MEYAAPELVSDLIGQIKINTKNHDTHVKFNFNFDLMSINPFISFIKKINQVPSLKIKTVFQLDCSVQMKDVEILERNNAKMIGLNNLVLIIKLSLFLPEIAAIKITNQKSLEQEVSLWTARR